MNKLKTAKNAISAIKQNAIKLLDAAGLLIDKHDAITSTRGGKSYFYPRLTRNSSRTLKEDFSCSNVDIKVLTTDKAVEPT